MHPKLAGLIAHTGKRGAASLARSLKKDFESTSTELLLEANTARLIGLDSTLSIPELGAACEILLVLGGDGTILQVVHDLGKNMKPIFGINLGSLGFLTCVNSSSSAKAVESILAGSYVLSKRTMLAMEVERGGKITEERLGLNDVVISRGEFSRLIKLKTWVDGAVLTEYNADGLIVATSTGSTAYSLAAGGPVMKPDSGVFVITPICPHVLTNRSVIVSDRSKIEISPCQEDSPVFLTVDGQELLGLRCGDIVRIRKARRQVLLATLPEVSFFEVLREKLKWSGSALGNR